MMYVRKQSDPPDCLKEWLDAQLAQDPVVNVNYSCFNDKRSLRQFLIAEQYGLCAYTGAPLDERLGHDNNYSFQSHIEHVKPRSVCEAELVERGGIYGRDVCEDVDYQNLIAALEVRRKPPSKAEAFGPSARGDQLLPVTPLQEHCESRFLYTGDGNVYGGDTDATTTLKLLRLDHGTLQGWRR